MSKKQLTFSEKMACKVMSKLRYNEKDEFYKCFWNDSIMWIACLFLGGRDPVKFAIWLLDQKKDDLWGYGDYRPKES